MTKLDDKLVPVALKLINKFGKDMSYTVITTEGSYDPATREITGAGDTTYDNVKSAPPEEYTIRFINGDSIKQGDLKTMIAGKDALFTPTNNMYVEFDGLKFAAIVVAPLYSGDLIAAWEIRLRSLNDG